jgi:glucose uptake protein
MILPSSFAITLALIIFGMLCWGSWASLFKAAGGASGQAPAPAAGQTAWQNAGKMRFELFYFDFAIGTVLAAIVCAFTFGTFGFDGFTFMDDLLHAAKKQDLLAVIGGAIFNLGNMLLLAAVAEGGLSVAFPLAMGVAIVVGSTWQFFLKPGENAALYLVGAVILVFGVMVCTAAYRLYMLGRVDELVRTGQQKSTRRRVSARGAVIAIVGGLILGSYFPLVSNAMEGEVGVGPYSVCVLFAVGIFLSTFFYNLFLMNLPVSGPPIEVFDYFKSTLRQHLLGLISGAVWLCGFAASLVSATTEGKAAVGPAISFGLLQGSVVIAALWGLLFWKEFTEADGRVRSMLLIMLVLLVCGIGLIAVAPFPTKL